MRGNKEISPLVPEMCGFNLDLQVVNLLEEMRKKRAPRKELLVIAYRELKKELGRSPSYLEFHLHANAASKTVNQEFGSYFGMLAYADELAEDEKDV